jgi:hypothetical protein
LSENKISAYFLTMSEAPEKITRSGNFLTQSSLNSWQTSAMLLEAELNNFKQVTDKIIDRLAEIQRDDGELFNGIVTRDSLASDVAIAFDGIDDLISTIQAILERAEEAEAAATAAGVIATNAANEATAAVAAANGLTSQIAAANNTAQLANAKADNAMSIANNLNQTAYRGVVFAGGY